MAVLLTEDDGAVRVLTLNRPERRNAVTLESYRALTDALRVAEQDPAVRVVRLRGAGVAFCAGADLHELVRTAVEELTDAFVVLVEQLCSFPKPVVAEVQGAAVGIGFTMLLHCDLVLVAEDARLRAPFTALGTAPEAGSSWLLPQVIGAQRAADLLLTSRWVGGTEAVELGLAGRSVPVGELAEVAAELSRRIAGLEPAAVAAAKRLLRVGRLAGLRAAMGRESEEAQNLYASLGPPQMPG